MLAFYPEFETSSSADGSVEDVNSYEVIFVIDLSNSMKGSAIEDAVKVILLSLHHLPSTCSFNIVAFGTGAGLFHIC
jgi:poly [ADP-ribose] polymerase